MVASLAIELRVGDQPVRAVAHLGAPIQSIGAIRRIDLTNRGQRRLGWYWAYTNGCHVEFFSDADRSLLLCLDSDPDVAHIVSQPIAFPHEPQRAIPSFLVERTSGDREFFFNHRSNVTTTELEDLAEATGWSTSQHELPGAAEMAALRWLSGYRHPRHNDLDTAAQILRLCSQAVPLRVLLEPGAHGAATLYHLVFTGTLCCNLSSGLDDTTLIELL